LSQEKFPNKQKPAALPQFSTSTGAVLTPQLSIRSEHRHGRLVVFTGFDETPSYLYVRGTINNEEARLRFAGFAFSFSGAIR
jgi:hypothetical protein